MNLATEPTVRTHSKNRLIKAFVGAILLLAQVPAFAEPLRVVTTIQTLASLAEEVGGEKVKVVSLSKGYNDPHFVEPKPNLVLELHKADLLIYVGLELEIGWLPPLLLNSRNPKVQSGALGNLDASTLVDIMKVPKIKVDRSMGDIHPLGNPHYWMPPQNAVKIAKGIADRLKKLDGTNASYFDSRLTTLLEKITVLERDLGSKIEKLRGKKVVCYHDSWPYVTKWLGLSEVEYVENKPGIPPSPQHLVRLIETMKKENINLILMEDFYNRDLAENVAKKAGAKLVELPSDVGAKPEIKSYLDLPRAVVDQLLEH